MEVPRHELSSRRFWVAARQLAQHSYSAPQALGDIESTTNNGRSMVILPEYDRERIVFQKVGVLRRSQASWLLSHYIKGNSLFSIHSVSITVKFDCIVCRNHAVAVVIDVSIFLLYHLSQTTYIII